MNSDELNRKLSFITTVPHNVSITGLFIGIPIILCGLFGNILIVVTIVKDKRLRLRQNVFVLSLALSDMMVVLTSDTFFIITFCEQRWTGGGRTALLLMLLRTFQNQSSIGHIVAITVYRYAMVVHGKAYAVISKLPVLTSVLLFLYLYPLLSGVGAVARMFKANHTNIDVVFTVNTKTMSAVTPERFLQRVNSPNSSNVTTEDTADGNRPDVILYVIIYLAVNCVLLVTCYIHTYVFVRRSSARLQDWSHRQNNNASSTNNQTKLTMREVKFIKTMAIVFVSFLCSYFWLPILAGVDYQSRWPHWVYFPFLMLNWASSSINWIVYGLTSSTFRQGFKNILKVRCQSVESTIQMEPGIATQPERKMTN